MTTETHLHQLVFDAIASMMFDKSHPVSAETPLIGDGAQLDSMKLVELCLALEERAVELGFEFDWTSEAAMSRSRGMFRNAGALAAEFVSQSQR